MLSSEILRALFDNRLDGKALFDELWENTIKPCIVPKEKRQLTNDQLVEFITRKIEIVLRNTPFRERLHLGTDVKKKAKAIALRTQGNDCFHPTSAERLAGALKYYNKSIAHAEKDSKERAIAYANRSLVCLQFEQHEECLVNIRLARESNCPERLVEKLNRREAIAKEGLLKPNSAASIQRRGVEELKLSYNCHANVPQVVECLELHRNEEFGRHVVTNRKLKAGDVVIIEKPFATLPWEDFRYSRCAHCHDSNAFTLIPCEGCTVAMYCSEECLSKAHQQYHRYECAVLRDLLRISGDCMDRGVAGLRTVAMAIGLFDHDLEAMKEHLDGLDESKVNAFTMDWRTATPKDIYDTVHVLSTNQTLRGRKELSLQIFFATIIHQLMLERTELGAICATSAEKRKLLFDLILRHWQTAQVNSITLHNMQTKKVDNFFRNHAMGYYPLISMLNHSCVPNVISISLHDGRCAIVAIKPIAAGEQLFDSYGFTSNEWNTPARIYYVKEFYQFTCRCDACELELDDDDDVTENDEDLNIVRRIEMMKTESEIVSVLKSYLNAAGRCAPSYKLTVPQLQLRTRLLLLHGTVSLGILNFKRTVKGTEGEGISLPL